MADTIFEALSQLGPGALGAEDADDKEAWFCQSRAIRMIMASSVQVDDNNFSCCELSICLAAKVIKAALHVSDWNADVLSTLKKWDLSQELLDSRRWQALASSSLTLSKLSSNFPKNTNEEGPKSMAIVEISHLCLQAAMVMFGTHFEQQGLLKANDDDELDEPNAKELECIYLAFEQLEQQLLDLASKSNTHIMGNAHFLRLNYYVHGMRQYPRLEKLSFKSKPTVAMQSSLDDFFTKSK